jgi:hypothetical protein
MNGFSPAGISPYTDLLENAHERNFHGIAVNSAQRKKTYILFINGYPEGAVVADNTGELYGDKAIYLIKGSDPFVLYPVNPDMVERVVYSCRIYDKSHFTNHYSFSIPEVGKKADGVGKAVIALKKDGRGVAGVPIRIRKEGQIIATDISDETGQASFRLLFGKYDIIIVRIMISSMCLNSRSSPSSRTASWTSSCPERISNRRVRISPLSSLPLMTCHGSAHYFRIPKVLLA